MSERNVMRVILAAFCISGAAALAYEVVWTRALSLLLGSTVYALSTLLATFMSGLALGAYLGGKIADRNRNLLAFFGGCEIGIGIFGIMTIPLIYHLPPFYFWMYKSFHLSPAVYFVMQFLLCAAIMIVPTTLMGATFPIVSKRLTVSMEDMGRKVGDAYSFNTIGAVFGSLSAGFLLIPVFGLRNSSFIAAGLNIVVGAVILLISGRSGARKTVLFSVVAFILLGTIALSLGTSRTIGTFYYVGRFPSYEAVVEAEEGRVPVYDKDNAQGSIRAFLEDGLLMIQHGGKMEGTAPQDVPNTMMLAAIPVAAYGRIPEDMLVIGLGAGVTTFFSKQVAGSVDVVEINPGVVEVVSRFGIPGTLQNVHVFIDDARRHLFLSEKKYDVITAELSIPSEAMSANLFSREFYEEVASRLKKGGVFCQWMPAWVMTKRDTHIAAKTFGSVFRYTDLWVLLTTHDFIMIGSNEPFRYGPQEIIDRVSRMELLPPPLPGLNITQDELKAGVTRLQLIRDSHGIRELVDREDLPLITDDRPYLDFAITKNLLYGPEYRNYRE